MALALALPLGTHARPRDLDRGQFHAAVHDALRAADSIVAASPSTTLSDQQRVTQYATRSSGDHSVETTTVTEQIFASHTLYAVHLRFVSGAEQSIVVAAPPGGLRPEMRDMSGDNIPNDVVLSSRLLGLPLVVLLNEGHDQLTVAISPGSFSSDKGRASGPSQVHHPSVLPTSGFRAWILANRGGVFLPELLKNSLPRVSPRDAKYNERQPTSGRAPPVHTPQV